jgi:signal transduction histidine kinase
LRACCAPVHTATGKIFGSVTVFEDVSTRKRVDQLKSEFTSMVAHELRAPLASIQQLIHAARSCPNDAQRHDLLLSHIEERTQGLLHMIGNMLNLSRLDSGAVVFNLEPVRGDVLLGGVVEFMRPQAKSQDVGLDFEPPKTEWWINADHDQIRNVFTNILDNAVKYTPAGGRVTVSIDLGGGLAVIRFADTGVGIKSGHLHRIFDRFFRVKDRSTRGIIGTGLGLSLAKRIIEAHKGRIDVQSEQGCGTTFRISLPLAEPTPHQVGSGKGRT